jgi:hypothetical protein
LNDIGIDHQSFLLLKAGIKPVLRMPTNGRRNDLMYSVCKKNGLSVVFKKYDYLFGTKFDKPLFHAYVSLSNKNAILAQKYEELGDRLNFGKMLGYPECCIDSFIKNFGNKQDFSILAYEHTKNSNSFYCNNIFNYDSKLSSEDLINYPKGYNLIKKYDHCYLVRHVPCSFDCQESIELGKKTLELLKNDNSEYANEIVFSLKNVFLYFDYFNWIVLEGDVVDNKIIYKNVLPHESLLPVEITNKIKKGNLIEVTDTEIFIYKDEKLMHKIQKKNKNDGIIMNFS